MRYGEKGINLWSMGAAMGEIEMGLTGKLGFKEHRVSKIKICVGHKT